jgi:hypothetical protein
VLEDEIQIFLDLRVIESGLDEETRFKDDVNELEDLDWEPDEDLNSKISLWRGDSLFPFLSFSLCLVLQF